MLAQEGTRGRNRNDRTVVATHAVYCNGDIHASVSDLAEVDKKTAQSRDALRRSQRASLFALGLDDLAAAVEAIRADVMAQMHFAGGRLDRQRGRGQRVVRTVHATLGRGLLVLLNGHGTDS